MEEQARPDAPVCGVVYGDIAFWTCLAGVAVGLAGLVWYLAAGGGVLDAQTMLDSLWRGGSAEAIWRDAAGRAPLEGHWYLKNLGRPDGLAMLGVAICCLGGVLGCWGALAGMVVSGKEKNRPQNRLYAALTLAAAVLLTLCAAGVLSLH